jgi:hypothetical protein
VGCASTSGIKYSIDQGKVKKSGNVGLKFRIENFKKNREARKEKRIEDRAFRKNSRKIKKFNRKYQSKSTIKMMKRSKRISKKVNRDKPKRNLIEKYNIYRRLHGGLFRNLNNSIDWIRGFFDKRPEKKKTKKRKYQYRFKNLV